MPVVSLRNSHFPFKPGFYLSKTCRASILTSTIYKILGLMINLHLLLTRKNRDSCNLPSSQEAIIACAVALAGQKRLAACNLSALEETLVLICS